MRRIILALILAVGICGVASAAVNNIQVSGDITTQAIGRNLSLGGGSNVDQENFLLSQIQLRFDADLTENVAAVIQILNERTWGTEGAANTDMDLDLAYIEMKEMFNAPMDVTIGRQNLRYGRGLVVGDPDTDNQVSGASDLNAVADDLSLRKSFDAIKVSMDYSPLVIDLIYAKIQENNTDARDDQNLYGFNAAMNLNDDTTGALYLFVKDADNIIAAGTNSKSSDAVYTVGTRAETTMVESMLLYGEAAYQFGRDHGAAGTATTDISREAYAVQLGGMFMLGDEADSKIGLEFTYLSGDDDSTDSDQEAWDPMFEDQRVGEIANLLFNNTNMMYIKTTGSTNLIEGLKAQLDIYYLRLAQELGSSSFTTASSLNGNSYSVKSDEEEIGFEIDTSLMYDYTEDVQMGLVGGILLPGDLFEDANDSTAYSIRATASVQF